jgi:excinuclease UvrABC ATPase subunit
MTETIKVVGAREHNLKNVTIEVPKNKLVAFTGVSGSGKSSLVFGTIYAEAQRQLLETFDAYARSRMPKMARPKVDAISDLPVAIVIDQKRLGGNSSSTVGTVTEIYNHMRLLFSRCGDPHIGDSVKFSFNRPEGMCPECRGSGKKLTLNEDALVDWNLSLGEGAIRHPRYQKGHWSLDSVLASGLFDPEKPLKKFTRKELDTLLYSEKKKMVNKTKDRPFNLTFTGVATMLARHVSIDGAGEEADDADRDEGPQDASAYFGMSACPACGGARLNAEARSVKVGGKTIQELCALELGELDDFLRKLPASMDRVGASVADSIVTRIRSRLARMIEIGIGYLSIDRPTATLSGGESQRVKMSRQLDCDLSGLVYILDEPSVGLHPSDVRNLVSIMRRLRDKGNTVIVIEHDIEIIRSADYVIDVGPTGGSGGGRITFEGDVASLERSGTLTGKYLARKIELAGTGLALPDGSAPRHRAPKGFFELRDARTNNLKGVSVKIPSGVLTCVTGVAGSGKSSLINGAFRERYPEAVVIDQSALTRSRRSTPASYTKVLDLIRKEFAKATGAEAGIFSFNSTGACPDCNGLGEIEVEMHFLESVSVPCERCGGKRFRDEALGLRLNGLNVAEVLESTVDDAIAFFDHPEIKRRLGILQDTGLGYLTLGQHLSSLSGGEAQRVKLASELRKSGNVYVMDEPTTGLHMADIERLSRLIERLVDAGNSVIVIEHNLELIAEADWVIDLGPCGGSRGGRIVAEGTPETICANESSLTGRFLREFLGYSFSSIPHQDSSDCSA